MDLLEYKTLTRTNELLEQLCMLIQNLNYNNSPSTNLEKDNTILSVEEAAQMLGVKVTTLRVKYHREQLPKPRKLGTKSYYLFKDIKHYLEVNEKVK